MRKEVNSIWDSKKVLSEEKKGGGQWIGTWQWELTTRTALRRTVNTRIKDNRSKTVNRTVHYETGDCEIQQPPYSTIVGTPTVFCVPGSSHHRWSPSLPAMISHTPCGTPSPYCLWGSLLVCLLTQVCKDRSISNYYNNQHCPCPSGLVLRPWDPVPVPSNREPSPLVRLAMMGGVGCSQISRAHAWAGHNDRRGQDRHWSLSAEACSDSADWRTQGITLLLYIAFIT